MEVCLNNRWLKTNLLRNRWRHGLSGGKDWHDPTSEGGNTPYVIHVHDFARRTNLAVEALSSLLLVQKLESLCKALHAYFSGSPKRHLEFTKLVEVVETDGLKILNKVQTRWISLLEPFKRICGEYKTLIVKFAADASQESGAQKHLSLLLDIATLLVLPCILLMLEAVQSLIT
jgi:hypothetical protein